MYTYTRKAFGTYFGFMAGWTLLLDYIFLPLLSYLLIGIYMSEYFPEVPAWVWALGSIALVTFLNLIGIESITRVNWVLIVAQLVFIVVFIALSISHLNQQAGPVSLLAPFHHEGFSVPLIMTGAAVLCLSFLGFDAVSTMAEKPPTHNVASPGDHGGDNDRWPAVSGGVLVRPDGVSAVEHFPRPRLRIGGRHAPGGR